MISLEQLLILFPAGLLCSVVSTKFLIYFLPYLGIVDRPSSRKIHSIPTPGAAGLGLIFIITLGLIIFEKFNFSEFNFTKAFLPPFLLIASVSFIDDIKELSIPIRLGTHFIAAFSVIFNLFYPEHQLFQKLISKDLDLLLTVLLFVGFLNIYNFLDGIDGITAAETIHLSLNILILCYIKREEIVHLNLVILLSILALSYASGFLPFNWYPAKIFIGDVGSISLGFILGVCLICLSVTSWELFLASIIASLYYLGDGGLTILLRLLNGEKIWQPHVKHFFQKAVKKGMSHSEVVIRISLCNSLLLCLSVTSLYHPLIALIGAFIVVLITLIRFAY